MTRSCKHSHCEVQPQHPIESQHPISICLSPNLDLDPCVGEPTGTAASFPQRPCPTASDLQQSARGSDRDPDELATDNQWCSAHSHPSTGCPSGHIAIIEPPIPSTNKIKYFSQNLSISRKNTTTTH